MKVIDLFCGCGGFSEGFRQAGFEIILAVDNWDVALKSHKMNHPETDHWLKDVLDIEELPEADVLIGSPPCQSFSIANRSTRVKDKSLMEQFMDLVERSKVRWWCWENVQAAVPKMFLPYMPSTVDCADYGAPSHRQRKFCCNWPFPAPTHKGHQITIGEALKGLTDVGKGLPPNPDPNFMERPNIQNWLKSHPRLKATDVMRTITTKVARDKRNLHFSENRPYTVNEVKRLMGFPDGYKLCGSLSDQYALLGNAVPPPMSMAIAEALKIRLSFETSGEVSDKRFLVSVAGQGP